jgi:hypothetical protein
MAVAFFVRALGPIRVIVRSNPAAPGEISIIRVANYPGAARKTNRQTLGGHTEVADTSVMIKRHGSPNGRRKASASAHERGTTCLRIN